MKLTFCFGNCFKAGFLIKFSRFYLLISSLISSLIDQIPLERHAKSGQQLECFGGRKFRGRGTWNRSTFHVTVKQTQKQITF